MGDQYGLCVAGSLVPLGKDETVSTETMTRQHFELIAEVLRDVRPWTPGLLSLVTPDEFISSIAETFADALADTNPRFNRERFLEAAGVTP